MRRALVLGLDVGTSFSSAAVFEEGETILALDEGDPAVPSLVHVSTDGTMTAGRDALRAGHLDPRGLVPGVKQLLGGPRVRVHEQEQEPARLLGALLGRLRELAEARVGCPIERAVLTVPAERRGDYAGDLTRAASLAGLQVVDVIVDAVAGVMADGVPHGGHRRIAVVDFGARSFTASLVEQRGLRFSLRGVGRHEQLGGDDLDEALARAVDRIAAAEKWSLRDDARVWGTLLDRCERIKRQLSSAPAARLCLPEAWSDGGALELKIDRAFCDPVFRPLAVDAAGHVQALLARAGWDGRSVDRVVLLGGTTHVPAVLEELSVVLERMLVAAPHATVAIARGAALLGTRHATPAQQLAACR